jgi:hypothetical protein
VSYDAGASLYRFLPGSVKKTRAALISDIADGGTGFSVATLTGHLRSGITAGTLQPLLSVDTILDGPTGNPDLPMLPGDNPMTLKGINVDGSAIIVVDGQQVSGTISCVGGSFNPLCDSDTVSITLSATPSPNGLHLLQVQNPTGLLSNELPICVFGVVGCR